MRSFLMLGTHSYSSAGADTLFIGFNAAWKPGRSLGFQAAT
jgi:hypothetical protein